MQLFGITRLEIFVQKHEDSRFPLNAWQLEVEEAQWAGPDEVQARYVDAFVQPDRVVFSIKNLYKIDVKTKFKQGILLIEKVWTPIVSKPGRSSVKKSSTKEQRMTHIVRVLKSDQELEAALQRMAVLMDQKLMPGSDDEAEFDLLKLVISDYEIKRVARPIVTPLQAIEFRMEQQRLTRKDLEPYIGSQSKVSEVLAGKRTLSLQMIRRLNEGLGIPAQALLHPAEDSGAETTDEEAYAYEKFPLKEMCQRGLLVSDAKEKAREQVQAFLQRIAQLDVEPALLRAPLHQSGARTMDTYALLIWRAVVVDKAHRNPPLGIYRTGTITPTWLRDLAKLSRFERGPQLAQEYLSQHGICLVIEPCFKKTYLDGCAMLDGDRPIVGLTLRHDRLDNFWFALLHEVVHVQKHLTSDCRFIADNLDDKARAGQIQEDEADLGAQNALIPPELWATAVVRVTHDSEDAKILADQAGVHPCIVAGRVRHETDNWRLMSSLINEAASVKACFSEQ